MYLRSVLVSIGHKNDRFLRQTLHVKQLGLQMFMGQCVSS